MLYTANTVQDILALWGVKKNVMSILTSTAGNSLLVTASQYPCGLTRGYWGEGHLVSPLGSERYAISETAALTLDEGRLYIDV